MTAPQTLAGADSGNAPAPAGHHPTFDAEMRALTAAGWPNLDNATDPTVIGAYGLEAPGGCTCPELPGEHTEDACAAQAWQRVRP